MALCAKAVPMPAISATFATHVAQAQLGIPALVRTVLSDYMKLHKAVVGSTAHKLATAKQTRGRQQQGELVRGQQRQGEHA